MTIRNNAPVHSPPKPLPSIALYVLLGVAFYAFIQCFSLLSPIILSFLLILLVSLAVNPVINRLRGLAGGRKLATGLIAVGFITIMALTALAFIGPMKESLRSMSVQLPGYWERLQKPLIKMEKQAVLAEEKLQSEVTAEITQSALAAGEPISIPKKSELTPSATGENAKPLRTSIAQMLQGVLGSFSAVAFNAAQLLVVFVTVFFGVIFTLMNPRPIMGAIFSLVPEHQHDKALIIMQRIGEFIPRWAGATLLGMLSIGLLVFLFMWPIFGFMDALVLGLIAGVLEAVPFLGPILSAVPALLLAVGDGGMTPLWVLFAYIIIQALENNLIIPLIMTRSIQLHPVAVIFSMLISVAAFGVLGVIIAAPLAAIVDILNEELYRKRFLPHVTNADLDRLARLALHEKVSESK